MKLMKKMSHHILSIHLFGESTKLALVLATTDEKANVINSQVKLIIWQESTVNRNKSILGTWKNPVRTSYSGHYHSE